MILERLSRVTAAMATPDEAAEVLAFAVQVLTPQKTRPLQPEGKERDLYHLMDWYLSERNGIALARDKETGALAGMMAVQAFDAPYHVEHIANVFDFASYYGYTAETAAVYRRTLIAEAYPRPQTLRAMVKVADAFARTQGYRYIYRHCHFNDLPVMLLWRRVGYDVTEESYDTGSVHMQKTL